MTRNPPSLRRLPGVRFDVPPPTLDLTLPRMDIALFVGFAGSGPLTAAVAVESLAEFETVFGGPLPLALDTATGARLTGHLHAAVRAFFSQGGRRCWVQRVAGAGLKTSRLPLPSLLRVRRRGAGRPWQLRPASLPARSPGSGADTVQVAARLLPTPLRARALDKYTLELAAPSAPGAPATPGALGTALRPGDLLRIALGPIRLHLRVAAIDGLRLRIDGRVALKPLLGDAVSMQPVPEGTEGADATPAVRHQWHADGRLSLWLRLLPQDLPQRGQVLALGFPQRRAWMSIDEPEISAAPGLDGRVEIVITGRPWRLSLHSARQAFEAWCADPQPRLLQLLRLDLRTRSSPGQQDLLADLSLASPDDPADPGARSVFGLPDDEQLFGGSGLATTGAFAERDALGRLSSRFDLASDPLVGTGLLVPLDDLDDFDAQLHALPSPLAALQRDGLHEFGWRLFAEPLLTGYGADLLAHQAEALRLTGPNPRRPAPLHGMHAAFGARPDGFADEPTLLLLPDAIHPGWQPIAAPPAAWTELPLLPEPKPEPPDPCAGEAFRACDSAPLPRPAFVRGPDPRADGSLTLFWTHVIAGADYELQQAIESAFDSAVTIQQGQATRFDTGPRKPGTAFYRVRARLGPRRSPWSAPVRIVIGLQGWETLPWQDLTLTAIHRLMLRTAAGRGDMLALLSLPIGYDSEQACRHADRLRSSQAEALAGPGDPGDPPAIGENESRALSHGALLHPWLMIRRDADEIWFPPDGPVCGQLAATALERGAWIAAANRPLRDVVSLSRPGLRPTLDQRQQLLDAQVNLLRSAPIGFIVSSSDTLSPAADWRPINVRRLMCLLRRLALQRGVTYVFEPNGATLRRTVERGFEAMLDQLYRRGALAGASAAQAFQVNVGDDINTRQRRDAGQFWVELKVAPALPMSFLTVLLMRSGERVQSQEVH
ncbi:phage tail sheath C-terminal domain-containing protein [Roseateles sp.]|uniref:phage tail sheath C-terminal domain-containing protein n=1 Tax=Roseateles sp. TaxID=1971397 RepID=UPI00286D3596|nr:phage tail sheath C-terminal domain-containing protein [Roseateles sp.]